MVKAGTRLLAVVELGGLGDPIPQAGEEFAVTEAMLGMADFDMLLAIGAVERVGGRAAAPKEPEPIPSLAAAAKDKAAPTGAGG